MGRHYGRRRFLRLCDRVGLPRPAVNVLVTAELEKLLGLARSASR